MPRIALNGGSYLARSPIASAQRALNLYNEPLHQVQGEPAQFASYPTPGLRLIGTLPQGPVRGMHETGLDQFYVVAGSGVYAVTIGPFAATLLGNLTTTSGPVSMEDNTTSVVIVDGTTKAFTISMATNAFAAIDAAISSTPFADTSTQTPAANTALYMPFTPSVTGTIGSITIYVAASTAHCKLAIYDGGTVLGTSNELVPGSGGSLAFMFSPAVDVSNTRTYNIAVCQDGLVTYGSTAGSNAASSGAQTYTSFPAASPPMTPGAMPVAMSVVLTPNPFEGADRVAFLDTYLLFNKPGTPTFFSSDSAATTFDPLWQANKTSYSDILMSIAVAKREVWLFGLRTTEIWTNAGTPDFPFGQIPATFVDHGCIAVHSVATDDNSVFWLTQDRQGFAFVMQGAGYQTKRVSTYAVEQAFTDYPLQDAIGFTYLLDGHACYVLCFPQADHTWVLDIGTGLWHEWLWTDPQGVQHRHRANCGCAVDRYGFVVGDWENGNIYALDHNVYTDNGAAITRQRSFPHVLNEGKRVFFSELIADIETGTGGSSGQRKVLGRCFFTAPDFTFLENYLPGPGDSIERWTPFSGTAQVVGNQVVPTINPDPVWYAYTLTPPSADYSVSAKIPLLQMVSGTYVAVIGRTLGAAGVGYQGGIVIASNQVYASLRYGGTEIRAFAGTVMSDTFYVTLTMVGTLITLTVQRTSDGLYLLPGSGWANVRAPAISVTDGTYTGAGHPGLMALWPPTGPMQTEDATGFWGLEDGTTTGSTTWNPADQANTTLSGGNLTATATSQGGVRSVLSVTSGKYYWETTANASTSVYSEAGIANAAAALPFCATSLSNTLVVSPNGGIFRNGTGVGNVPSFGTGAVICHALDMTAGLYWVRVGASGSWNAMSGTANNPATGTGGIALAPLTGPMFALMATNNAGDGYTANFGASAFSGAVPSGFTAGFGNFVFTPTGFWEWDETPDTGMAFDDLSVSSASISYQLALDWSDDRGHTYNNPIFQTLGGFGEYTTSVQYQRLGYARDRVWRLTLTAPIRFALQGVWLEAEPGLS